MNKEFKRFCVHVGDNPKLMKLVQKRAFKLGYGWTASMEKKVQHVDNAGLYFYVDGTLAYGDSPATYTGTKRPRISLEEFFDLSAKNVVVEKMYSLRVKGPDYDDEFQINGDTAKAVLELLEERGFS